MGALLLTVSDTFAIRNGWLILEPELHCAGPAGERVVRPPEAKVARRVLLGTAACLIAGAVVFWVLVVDPGRRHLEFCRATRADLKPLATKRPPDLTREQWHHVVAWTLNGHGNILTCKRDIPQAERDRFMAELRERLAGPTVDLATIDWIWDQFERLSPGYGPVYSGRYRPTDPERLREFQREGFTWAGLEVE